MSAQENATRVREGYEAFNTGDLPTLIDLFDEGIVWHFPGGSKLAGEHVGRDATLRFLGEYGAAAEGTLHAEVIDVMASDEHVAGWARDTAAARGRSLDVHAALVFRMREGRAVEAWHCFDDVTAVDRFLT
jgi:ketosteroid isomerase-like protein